MAALLKANAGQQNATSAFTPNQAGNLLVVVFVWDPNGANTPTISAVTDAQSNTYSSITTWLGTATSSGAGSMMQVWYTILNSTASINPAPTWSGTAASKFLRYYMEFNGIVTTSPLIAGSVTGTSTTGPLNLTTPSATQFGDLFLAIYAQESNQTTYTGSTDTTNGTWVTATPYNFITTGGNSANNQSIALQYKIANAAGTTTARLTTATAAPTAGGYNIIAFTSQPTTTSQTSGSVSLSSGTVNVAPAATVNFVRQTPGSISISGSSTQLGPFLPAASEADLFLQNDANSVASSTLAFIRVTSGSLALSSSGTLIPQMDYGAGGTGSLSLSGSIRGILQFYRLGSGSITVEMLSRNFFFDTYPRSGTGSNTVTSSGSVLPFIRFLQQTSASLTITPLQAYLATVQFIMAVSAGLTLMPVTSPTPRQFIYGKSALGGMSISARNDVRLVTTYFYGWGRPL